MGHTRKPTILILQDESISFPTLRIVTMFNSGFRSLSKFGFKCSAIQRRGTVVLDSMSFETLSCQGGASICICTSKALILRVLV